MKISLFSRLGKNNLKVKTDLPTVRTEEKLLLFYAAAISHLFHKTGANKCLQEQEAVLHVSRLVMRMRSFPVAKGWVPHVNCAKSLAKHMLKELEEKYPDLLKYMLLDSHSDVEDIIVSCLHKHAKRQFEKKSFDAAYSSVLLLLGFNLGVHLICLLAFFIVILI